KVTDGKQSQWRLPSGGSPQASSEAGAGAGAEGGTDAPTAVSSPSTLDRSPADTDLPDGNPANATVADLTDADDKGEPDDNGPAASNQDDGEGDGARPPAVPAEHDGQADGSNNVAADTMADDAAGDTVAPRGEPGTPAGPDQADD